MNVLLILDKVKKGIELSFEELEYIINGYANDSIPDYQMSVFLTSVCINGLSKREINDLVKLYIDSGEIIDFEGQFKHIADKHSTGGVGDKTSLIIAPLVASCGVTMAKMSGRGLGHTGGTVDKLESIEGFNVDLTDLEFIDVVKNHHVAIIGQTKDIAVADKKIYALRDVTSTVDSIPLIAASIMSKKLASGANNIVIDVKVGKGAILDTYEKSVELAKTMVSIGKSYGKNINAVLSDMNQPLGFSVGNKLEVIEAKRFLSGSYAKDLYEICMKISALIVSMCLEISEEKSVEMLEKHLADGSALKCFNEFITAQGGNINDIPDNYSDVVVENVFEIKAEKSGYITNIDAFGIANTVRDLGAGRLTKEDVIDFNVGIVFNKKVNDIVVEGEVIATIYANKNGILNIEQNILNSIEISNYLNENIKIIYDII